MVFAFFFFFLRNGEEYQGLGRKFVQADPGNDLAVWHELAVSHHGTSAGKLDISWASDVTRKRYHSGEAI